MGLAFRIPGWALAWTKIPQDSPCLAYEIYEFIKQTLKKKMMNIIYESMVNHLREKALDEIMIIYDIYIYIIIICNMYVCDIYIIIYI